MKITNLRILLRDSVEDGAVRAVGHAALLSRLGVVLIALSKALGTKIVGIAKRLVDALKRIVSCHKDLAAVSSEASTMTVKCGCIPARRPSSRPSGEWPQR